MPIFVNMKVRLGTQTLKISIWIILYSHLERGGFVVKGNVRVQFRKQLGEAPVIGAIYTPWITINGSFVEELVVDVVDGKLSASHSQLHLNRTDNQYKEIFDQFVLPYLKNEVVKRINEEISNFNGMTVE